MNRGDKIIYVVDDNAAVSMSLKLLLKLHGFKVETFTSAEGFLSFKYPKKPSCLVSDIRMPGGISGLALQDAMVDRQVNIPIVFISSYGDILMCVKAMQAGAVDFLTKPYSEKKLLSAIGIAIEKNKTQIKKQIEISKVKRHVETLSPRELEVFRFVAQGMLNKQIASKRGITIQTIKIHRSRVMHKMQAKTLTELIHLAQKVGITSPSK